MGRHSKALALVCVFRRLVVLGEAVTVTAQER